MSLTKRTGKLPFIFDDFFTADWLGGTTNFNKGQSNIPAVNVKETDGDFTIELAVPGLTDEDFNIELNNEVLTISSKIETIEETTGNSGTYTRKEFNYDSFERSFNVPDTVDSSGIEASYKNGVLSVVMPKKEEAKIQPKRLIEVS